MTIDPSSFKPGQRVRHATLGEGFILLEPPGMTERTVLPLNEVAKVQWDNSPNAVEWVALNLLEPIEPEQELETSSSNYTHRVCGKCSDVPESPSEEPKILGEVDGVKYAISREDFDSKREHMRMNAIEDDDIALMRIILFGEQ